MNFAAVTPDEMRNAQVLSLATFAFWIGVGVFPGLRPYAARIRIVVLVLYLIGCASFIGYVLVR